VPATICPRWLLESQLETLEEPVRLPVIDATPPPADVAAAIRDRLHI
jgi:hypothetical protein